MTPPLTDTAASERTSGRTLLTYWLGAAALTACLFLTSRYSYLLFHTAVELFAAAVALAMFTVAWNTRRFNENGYLLFLGIATLPVGLLDLTHALAYKGMALFREDGADLPTQLWIAARILQAASLLAALRYLGRRVPAWPALTGGLAAAALLLLLIFPLDLFPVCFSEKGPLLGLTPFKVNAEYAVCIALAFALAGLCRHRQRFPRETFWLLLAGVAATMLAELAFTRYVTVHGDFNCLGHLLKAVASLSFYKATVEGALRNPYKNLFHDLRSREQEIRRLHDSMRDAFVVVDMSGRVLACNAAYREMLGYSLDELRQLTYLDLTPQKWHAFEAKVVAEQILPHGTSGVYEKEYRRKDGTLFPVELRTFLINDDAGTPARMWAIVRDISERKQAEAALRHLNEGLEQRVLDRTAALESANRELEAFCYSVSHDLRTPLRTIDGFSMAALEDCAGRLDETGIDYLRRVREGCQQMDRLIDALLNLSRLSREQMRREAVDLSALTQAAAAQLREGDPGRAVDVRVEPGLRAVGDARLLRAAIANLLGNAWKFTARHSAPSIEVGSRRDAPVPVAAGMQQPPAEGRSGPTVFFVRDNGVGFDMRYADKLFGAFQRLHSARDFPGTGIGLATVARIVRRHGGRIWAESEPDRGATFFFTLEPDPQGPPQ